MLVEVPKGKVGYSESELGDHENESNNIVLLGSSQMPNVWFRPEQLRFTHHPPTTTTKPLNKFQGASS
jgi:hypothetical protein